MYILFLVVSLVKLEYLVVKATNSHQKMLFGAAMPCPGAFMSQFLALSASGGTADSRGEFFPRRPTLQSPQCQQFATYMDVHVIRIEVILTRVLTRVAVSHL